MASTAQIGIVVIGRNEGERFLACLKSLAGFDGPLVYVDSGSTDGSVAAARDAGASVVELDMARPFTAARARNAGLAVLVDQGKPEFVQFIDGDCQLVPGWLETASDYLATHENAVAVAGRLRECHPEKSVFNRLCDAEWKQPAGQVDAIGGIAMMRLDKVQAVGGFCETLVAGEEPELCLRLRREGGEIWRLEQDMALHDANMTRFSQWWRRSRRAGYAYAEGCAMHGAGPERHYVAELGRILFWAGLLPVVILALALIGGPWARYALALYPLQVLRLVPRGGAERAFFLTLGKFPEMLGVLEYWVAGQLVGARKRYEK
ncbi:glycosyltransferase [Aliiruegeria sabulilitoris]|uniref:glycosyltransferase n=1 Tax=Aliiruegeria sabulilitoris TaxID=1510458 RepID=UPI000B2EB417|nr:glycosyltransferase family A protein [Aliiruegeria sabulilitoris]